ncbi:MULTISPECIES: hypothetical protein [unclassified Brevundimonas]|uniref:hypothetical protein n=1 Tax=unclassified Brevundimonas TaxID=2622653 RepID=UPI0025B89D1F|nr:MULTISPECIES: hypothetical protein [unclassified Brevundimonas]
MAEPRTSVLPEDIINGAATETQRLEQEADAILAKDVRPLPIHEAVREDAAQARVWADQRVKRARDAIRDEPVRASLYALGIGVIIGLLAAR